MESIYLRQAVKNTPKGAQADLNAPYSFLEWKDRLPSLVERDANYHYNKYVLEWFQSNKDKVVSQKFVLRQRYLYLLDQLQLFFTEEEKNTWYAQVNLADEKELLLSIPYFARKLKDIALYYLKLRKQLKNTKLQYNMVGSTGGIQQEIYNYFLGTFSTSNNELSSFLYTTLPSFSSLQNSLVVDVEELYDDKQYFDLSPTQPLSGYFDFSHEVTKNFLATKGIILSSADYLFESFNVPVSTTFDSFVSQLTGNIFELSDDNLYGSFIQKYIAQNKYSLEFASVFSVIEVTDVPLEVGNNYFYYPYGTTDASISRSKKITSVALSSITIEGASSGETIEQSDTIFVKNGDETKSAWLHYNEYNESSETIKASMKKDSTTSFIFPYPGYGLSAQDVEWTGSSFETTAEYDFLTKQLKAQVNNAYWSQALPADSCESILLNNTTLVSSRATSNINPLLADQIYIRNDRNEDTSIPRGELSGAWLYKFTRTTLPISPNSQNVFLWPYDVVDTEEEFPEYLEKVSYLGACNAVSIHDISKSFSIAASSIELADKIYKLNNFADNVNEAFECAWLSGSSTSLSGYKFTDQDGFAALFPAGEVTRFIWTGEEATLESVFCSAGHKKDCPFTTNISSVSAFEWQKCSCKQVYYSPFGHPSKIFEINNMFADCVIQDTENNLGAFDFGSWRDSTNNPTFSSVEFAWYKTKTEHSWGDGQWVSNSSLLKAPFTLKTGKVYFYSRSTSRTQSLDMPSYVVNYSFDTNKTKWIEGKLQNDGSWISTNNKSNMSFYPGDFIKYERQQGTTSYLLSSVEVENISENIKENIWSTYDTIAAGSNLEATTISWPIATIPFGSTDIQYPTTSFLDITAINAWNIIRLEDNVSQTITNLFTITFVPPTTGTYSIAVTATKAGGTKVFESSIIPQITAVSQYANDFIEFDFTTPSSGFLLEHSLNGWNYNTNKIDSRAAGARPYWVPLNTQKDSSTKYKGIYSWGYSNDFVDGYLPKHNPKLSPLEISYGKIIEYFHKGYSFTWNQPIGFKEFDGTSTWCEISSNTTEFSNLSSFYKSKQSSDLTVIPKTTPTDIILSNTLNGAPVEIYYYALQSLVWPISIEVLQESIPPASAVYFESQAPWTTLTNRFYPTIANVPVIEETYSLEYTGGYFLPQNLGASQFINKDFSPALLVSNLSATLLSEDTNIHIGGRGRTKEDQNTIYDWTENNQWLKESATTGDLAGAVKKTLTKTLQTFVPYQSNIEETALGLVTPRSRISPWGGLYDEQWTDVANEPRGFTGVRNVSAWAATQILKQNEQTVDCWVSDIYGNQYGLFKQLDGIPVAEHINTSGELWTRTNDQVVDPAYVSLSAVFEPFKYISQTIYKELTGQGIKSIDCFFDNLFIETESCVIFAGIDYNFENAVINSTFDDTRYVQLTNNLKFDRNWFFTAEKKVTSLLTEISGNTFRPALYEIDLPTRKYKKVFPSNSTDEENLTRSLSAINFTNLSRGSIHFNNSLYSYLITYTGTNIDDKMFVIDFRIKSTELLNLTEINIYEDAFDISAVNEPPIVLVPYLSTINIGLSTFSVNVSAINNPFAYTLLNYTTEVSVVTANGYGSFVGTLSAGLHHINYIVSNNIGDSIYCLTLSAL